MKLIKLTQGYFVKVDDEDFEHLNKYKGYADKHYKYGFVIPKRHTKTINGKRENLCMHRVIMNAPKGKIVDHANGDTLDNRKCNLRICTILDNTRNKSIQKNNQSGYKGVHLAKKTGHWYTSIGLNNKILYGGTFKNKIDAAKKYNEMAIKYFGEFAKLNDV